MVNITYLASTYHGGAVPDPAFTGAVDHVTRFLVTMLFEAKFYLLFSFLFGYGFTLQLNSAARSGARFTPRFLRRLGGLYVLGTLHAVLLFPGDILTTYAVLGLVLLWLRRLSPAAAVRIAVGLFACAALLYLALGTYLAATGAGGPAPAEVAAASEQAAEALRGTPAEVVGAHLDQLPDVAFLLLFFQMPAALACYLLGLAAGRRELLAVITRHRRTLARVQWVGYPVGLAGGAFYAYASLHRGDDAAHLLALGVDMITAPVLAAAYGATVLRLLSTLRGRRLRRVLAPVGTMTLTHYLTQSLVCALLFTGYGAALVNRVSPLMLVAAAVALFGAQALASRRWLRRHRYGPAEWLLRAVTLGARPPGRGRHATRPGGGSGTGA
ncbi:DUF418 domain-containing protein [Streptomyces chumphonensis]|uniref:DUF418 domain-containing protein n=2 Tax=Streptomyces chumphonensis TaxID=1214925 RepID=A0A927IDB6_9ACTN|nr:DUF418 domain-containing protein [Streptomyces chumphonensis]